MTQSTRFAPGDAPEFDVPNIGLFELIFGNLDDFDVNRLAIDDGVQETTFGELKDHAEDVAKVLNSMGIGRGQRVALHCPNSAEFAGMFLGILKARAVCVVLLQIANFGYAPCGEPQYTAVGRFAKRAQNVSLQQHLRGTGV